MISDIIYNGVSGMDGAIFGDAKECPECSGTLVPHDNKKKRFATVIEHGAKRMIYVNVRRFRCKACGKLVYARSPFYPDIRMGSPIVDFCIANTDYFTYNHISKILKSMRILVDPKTIGNYEALNLPKPPSIEISKAQFPVSLLNLSNMGVPGENPTKNAVMLDLFINKNKKD